MSRCFIVLEGPDGSGTTTQSKLLADRFMKEGKKVLLTSEPTSGPIGKFIREALKSGDLPSDALQLLFTADRAWHLENEVVPALNEGKIVISDRYLLSTLMYGEALHLKGDWLESLNKYFIRPSVHILALPSFEVCKQRLSARHTKDIMEEDGIQRRVYDVYSRYAKSHAEVFVFDTEKSMSDVTNEMYQIIVRHL